MWGGVKWSLLLQLAILLRKSKTIFGLKIKSNTFKKFTFIFGVIKINIDSTRARDRSYDHLTHPHPLIVLKQNIKVQKIKEDDRL